MPNSAYLLGFLALLLPLALHFLNRQQAPLVRIGSIQWLKNTPISRAQESTQGFQNFWLYRFTQIRLLLLRSLILLFLVFILAEIVLEMPFFEKKQQKWLLISPTLAQNEEALKILDSCQKLDYQIRWFADEFTHYSADETNQKDTFVLNYFERLEKLYAQKNEFETAIVLLDPLQKNFRTAPKTWEINEEDSTKIKILSMLPSEKPKPELVKAYFVEPSTLHLLWSFSEKTANRFVINRLQTKLERKILQDSVLDKVEFFEKEGNWFAKKPTEMAVLIEKKASKKIEIIHDPKNTDEANYVRKALEAVQSFAEEPLEITLNTNFSGKKTDFLIWLSSQKMPVIADPNVIVFESKMGKTIEQKSQILEKKQEKGVLLKRIESTEQGQNIWENNAGEAILLAVSAHRFSFYSRFRQDWGDFDRVLPHFFLKLFFPPKKIILQNDRLMIDPAQLKPIIRQEKNLGIALAESEDSVFLQGLAFLLLILIGLERFWTHRS